MPKGAPNVLPMKKTAWRFRFDVVAQKNFLEGAA
jgi:hypothetical protein